MPAAIPRRMDGRCRSWMSTQSIKGTNKTKVANPDSGRRLVPRKTRKKPAMSCFVIRGICLLRALTTSSERPDAVTTKATAV